MPNLEKADLPFERQEGGADLNRVFTILNSGEMLNCERQGSSLWFAALFKSAAEAQKAVK